MNRQLRLKTLAFAAFVILSNAFGNLFISLGMHKVPEVASPAAILTAIFNPMVALGIVLLISWLLTRMAMLSWADLTYVLPVTAFGYVVSAALGGIFQNETITPMRWAGILLIVAGTTVVGLGDPHAEIKP